jgi:hypothetical protein
MEIRLIGIKKAPFTLCLLAMTTHAEISQERMTHCANVGTTYQLAADLRNSHASPQQALNSISGFGSKDAGMTIEFKKKVINQVYFDPRFTYAGGRALYQQMFNLCAYPEGIYKPLK